MSINDDLFFNENVAKVNKTVNAILLGVAFVPFAFIIFTLIHIWIVPYTYSIGVFVYTIIVYLIQYLLNRDENNVKKQQFSMYFGMMAIIGFVDLLGYKSVIAISISYVFGPFISCLYYNKKLTLITCICDYLSVVVVTFIRSKNIFDTLTYTLIEYTPFEWFISTMIGITIEFSFVFFVCAKMSQRTHKTLYTLLNSYDEQAKVTEKLKERNQYIIKINNEIDEKNIALRDTQFKIIEFVSKCLGSHDLFTGQHVIHTKKYVEILCKELQKEGYYSDYLTDKNIMLYTNSAFLHDIGKIHIPEGVLNKVGKFTSEEFALMKCHPEEGKKLLEYLPKIDNGQFNEIAIQMAYCHHEKWDGTGYPQGLKGDAIPLCARIMAAADVLDALISQRLYKKAISIEEAMEVFKQSMGLHFEPCIAQAVINCKDEIAATDQEFKTREASTQAQELEWWERYHANLNFSSKSE